MNKVEEITKCKEMLDNGLITPEEFNEMKSAIINNTDKDAVSKRNEESLNTNITRKKTRSINKDSIVNKIKDKKILSFLYVESWFCLFLLWYAVEAMA